jgi:putative ABC transport system permease protein
MADTTAVKEDQDIELIEGRMWTDAEEERRANVVVLGHDAAEDLFPTSPPSARMSNAKATSSR